MSEQNTPIMPNGEHDGEHDIEPADSLQLILGYARQSYLQQFATLDAYRARAASLLAFAAVLVTFSAGAAPRDARSLLQAGGTIFVLASAVLFLIVSLGEGLRVTPSRRTSASSPDSARCCPPVCCALSRVQSSSERASPSCYSRSNA